MIYLVRHGQTEFNMIGRFQGGLDSPLTALGRRQAQTVGRTLAGLVQADTPMVVSPLGRAVATAQIIRAAAGLTGPLTFDPRLAEITIGEWDGLTDEDIEFAYPGARKDRNRWDWHFHAPGGETYQAFSGRLAGWLAEQAASDAALIAVSHGGCSRVLRGLYAGMAKDAFLKLQVPQDAIFRLHDGRVEQIDCGADAGA
jgi:broad specificity phosphatase PhoE